MIDLATLQIVRDFVAIFGVIAGLTYYIMNVRNARKARQTQLYMPIYNRMIEERIIAGERKTSLLLPNRPELIDSSEMYLTQLKKKSEQCEKNLRILHVGSDDLFAFLPSELCIFNPFSSVIINAEKRCNYRK